MALIMENWRKFTDEAQKVLPCGDQNELKLFLFENNSPTPTSEVLIDSLIEDCENELINEEQLFNYLDESFEYEYQQLLEEGFIDILKAPAKTKAAIKAKHVIKQKVGAFVARLFAMGMKLLKFLVGLIGKGEKKMLSVVTGAKEGKVNQGAVVKIYEAVVAKVIAGAKKIIGFAKTIIGKILKVFTHPLFKAAVLVLCAGIMVLSISGAFAFTGALLCAPAFASRRLGVKGATAFWKTIPNQPAVATEILKHTHKNKNELLVEVVDFMDIMGQAIADLASDIPEGAEDMHQFVAQYAADLDHAENASVSEDFVWISNADQELHIKLSAIESLQLTMEGNMSGVWDFEELMSMSKIVDDELTATIQTALKVAEQTCGVDPALCEASRILSSEFQTFNISSIISEDIMVSKSMIQNDDIIESWSRYEQSTYVQGTDTVVSNPFAPDEMDVRAPGEAGSYTHHVKKGSLPRGSALRGAGTARDMARAGLQSFQEKKK